LGGGVAGGCCPFVWFEPLSSIRVGRKPDARLTLARLAADHDNLPLVIDANDANVIASTDAARCG
jgi:hypothetical protein